MDSVLVAPQKLFLEGNQLSADAVEPLKKGKGMFAKGIPFGGC